MRDAGSTGETPRPRHRLDGGGYSHAGVSTLTMHETMELYRLLIDTLRDYAVFVLDETGHVMTWNPGAERAKGYTADEIIGKHFSIFYPQADIEAGKPDMELREALRVGRYEDEGWRLRKDGSRFWANVIITAMLDDHGRLVGFAKVTRDLTERRMVELRAVEDARRMALVEAANLAKSEFLAAMSHELRTPLNAIGGYVDLISLGIRGPVTDQQIEDLKRIRRSQQHLLGIINDLLNFSRIESGQVSYDLELASVREILDTVDAMTATLASAKRISLTWPRNVQVRVYADKSKVEQILLNLLTNAIKFTDVAGSIRVSCTSRRDRVSIEVTDTGSGIDKNKLETIFEPFVQIGRSHTSPHEGTGLGLSISRDLARAMDGELTVRSEVAVGSTFTLVLPRRPVPARA